MTGKTTSQSTDMALNNSFGAFVYEKTIAKAEVSLQEIFTQSQLITELQQQINYQFQELDHLIESLTHRSFVHEFSKQKRRSYERLEFLGDAVLGSYITYELFTKFADESEGKLSKLRSALVNERALADIGRFIKIDQMVLLGKGELVNPINDSIICDVFEALIGAVTMDTDMNRAYELLQDIIGEYESFSRSAFIDEKKLYLFDPKSTLQELTMREYKTLPEYRAKSIEEGFLVELHINDQKVDEIIGHSKKQLQKELALRYLNSILD